mmetsp:Transcript_10304/g.15479  ORF Transcript_10304/g.15479 Transcript_10304/m.15479 type:complete len:319 (+) Transcript_10304:2464-3420(+)
MRFVFRLLTSLQLISFIVSLNYRPRICGIKPSNEKQLKLSSTAENEIGKGLIKQTIVGEDANGVLSTSPLFVLGTLTLLLLPSESAFADASSFGILAGRTASMVHPITNLGLFATSLYTAYLGFQWRRLRDIGEELKVLTSQLPSISSGKLKSPTSTILSSLLLELESLKVDKSPESLSKIEIITNDISIINQAKELDSKITELTSTRKDLLSLNLRDKHYSTGSVLLGLGVGTSFLGAFNTFIREGEIFPDSHLFAGMGITALWAMAASLVPAMQKGNETARTAHIVLNVLNLLLFAWQIPTGLDIMFQTWGATSWP